ncbi:MULTISPECIES: UDP-glucose dehydrogenase family protein [Pseudomonas]|uniref:UDP-glucose 6-dehydrogenase n=1 Tax=Pseudomonas putida (strain W619) TaxID=390235 RepID=B1JA55_PSEPW|nr:MULTISPECIES: UDP-glucose/GDP-mannose dehydrogenase family protein [Pseudomonas]MDH1572023.1 UDP-glucose/GDP-mannose dehydrogenase family protein [Pseudomonas sp. GD03746]QQE82178.1 UDP-glucose/GDP-mannose dehydrogenase family protein [Pseudomonas putida]HEN8711859.1 UDP-glucose/GDP-mannose dehydrogenase family protein [Pseudomonas putida]HEN8716137.1 UDP-glucose/GDP-mannose dehydrogenase family protein [Pseudomonas putida]
MDLCVIGAGYVGLVTAACFAGMGNRVVCLERDPHRLAQLRQGQCPIHEPGLQALLQSGVGQGLLSFSDQWQPSLAKAQVVFIAVGTPSQEDGSADLEHVLAVADSLGRHLPRSCLVVNKSTVPVGTAERVARHVMQGLRDRSAGFTVEVASNPEFLKEGSAIDDFMRPDRIIIGTDNEAARQCLQRLYAPFVRNRERILVMSPRAAEFSKYAANAFLATKISFINELAGLCAHLGVDIEQVRHGIGSDRRIGSHFIYAGCGYGGSCFPKDIRALVRTAEQQGYQPAILRAVQARNDQQKTLLFTALQQHFGGFMRGRTVAVWGLAFKPGTDDLREAPSLVLLDALLAAGTRVQACDPVALAGVAERYAQALANGQLKLTDDPYACVEGADALALVTEWKQFRQPDFSRVRGLMRMPVIFDGRNIYDPLELSTLGYLYHGIGRPQAGHCKVTAA